MITLYNEQTPSIKSSINLRHGMCRGNRIQHRRKVGRRRGKPGCRLGPVGIDDLAQVGQPVVLNDNHHEDDDEEEHRGNLVEGVEKCHRGSWVMCGVGGYDDSMK